MTGRGGGIVAVKEEAAPLDLIDPHILRLAFSSAAPGGASRLSIRHSFIPRNLMATVQIGRWTVE